MASHCLKQEFKRTNLLLEHENPENFTTSQWRCPPVLYLLYRLVSALYFVVCLVLTAVLGGHRLRWFIFLTNWTFLLLTVSYVVMAATALHYYLTKRRAATHPDTPSAVGDCRPGQPTGMGWVLKLQWVLYNISTTWSVLTTIIYWSLLWHPSRGFRLLTFTTHGSNCLFLLVDLLLNAVPLRLLHLYQPTLYLLLYMVFGALYVVAGGTDRHGNHYIYHVIDLYNKPGLAAAVGGGALCVGVPLVWGCLFGLVRLRIWLVGYWRRPASGGSGGGEEGEGQVKTVVVQEPQGIDSKIESCDC